MHTKNSHSGQTVSLVRFNHAPPVYKMEALLFWQILKQFLKNLEIKR